MKKSKKLSTLTAITFLIASFVMAQDRPASPNQQRQGSQKGLGAQTTKGQKKKRFGAPRGVRSGQNNGGPDRKTIRKPFNNSQPGSAKPNTQKGKKPQGGQQGPKGGMKRAEKPQKPDLKKALELSEEQAKAMGEARAKLHKAAKGIHSNKELSKEQKQARLKEAFKRFDAAVQKILSPEQYTKLKHIRRQLAKPNREEGKGPQQVKRPGGEQGKAQKGNRENRAQHHRRIAEALKLTDDQKKKLHSIHQHAVKRIRAIVNNKELGKEDKKKLIGQVHKTAHNRRMQVFTPQQRIKLAGINAFLRAKNKPENGRPPQPTTCEPAPQPKPKNPSKGKGGNISRFPGHWGKPPAIQTRDLVKLPGNFGRGSSTLAKWIEKNLKADNERVTIQPVG